MSERKYLPTLSELVDRLSIAQLKEVFITEHKDEYSQEISDIAFPNFGTGVTQDVTIEINCNGVQFSDDGNIGPR